MEIEVIKRLRGEFRRSAPEQVPPWAFVLLLLLAPSAFMHLPAGLKPPLLWTLPAFLGLVAFGLYAIVDASSIYVFDGVSVSKRRLGSLIWEEPISQLQAAHRSNGRGGDVIFLQWPSRRRVVVCSRDLRGKLAQYADSGGD